MTPSVTRIPLLSPAPGTERLVIVRRYGEPGARPKAYLQASIHADELPGMLAAHHLGRLLDEAAAEDRILGEIVLIPVANPIGLAQRINGNLIGRYELDGGGNFNRNWPNSVETVVERVGPQLGANVDEWNWWGFSNAYTFMQLGVQVIGWLLAGFAIGAFVRGKSYVAAP